MNAAIWSLAPLLIGISMMVLGNGALNTVIPLTIDASGLPAWTSGIIMSAYFFGCMIGPLFAGRLISRIGHIRTFGTLVALASTAVLAHPFLIDPWIWGVFRFIFGFCVVGIFTATESWLNARASNAVRGKILSIYVILIFLFQGLGQFLINIPDATGIAIFALISAILSLSAVPILAVRTKEPELPTASRFNLKKLYKTSPLGVIGIFLSGLIFGSFFSMGPLYAKESGLSLADTAVFISAAYIGGLVLQWPAGWLSDKIGRRPVMIAVAMGIIGIALLIVLLPSTNALIQAGLSASFGAFYFILYPLCIAYTNDYLEPEDLVSSSGGLLMINNIGNMIGPLAAVGFMGIFGPKGLFVFCCCVGVALLGTTMLRVFISPNTPDTGDTAYQPVTATSIIAAELDPRGDINQEEKT